jgi:hypothetical protein
LLTPAARQPSASSCAVTPLTRKRTQPRTGCAHPGGGMRCGRSRHPVTNTRRTARSRRSANHTSSQPPTKAPGDVAEDASSPRSVRTASA